MFICLPFIQTSSSVTYSVAGADGKFGVTKEGVIYVNGSLDYETEDVLTFTVRFLVGLKWNPS
jgi:hypothetical protein